MPVSQNVCSPLQSRGLPRPPSLSPASTFRRGGAGGGEPAAGPARETPSEEPEEPPGRRRRRRREGRALSLGDGLVRGFFPLRPARRPLPRTGPSHTELPERAPGTGRERKGTGEGAGRERGGEGRERGGGPTPLGARRFALIPHAGGGATSPKGPLPLVHRLRTSPALILGLTQSMLGPPLKYFKYSKYCTCQLS